MNKEITGKEREIFQRTELLVGESGMECLRTAHVIVFGIGGVGSWCAESLVRSGVRHITLVDSDRVCTSNINRQLMATIHTVGEVKVEAMKRHLLEINPEAEITAIQKVYSAESADSFKLEEYDYIVDAIDSLEDKALLIRRACETNARFYSSMGAALKMNPEKVAVSEFWKVRGCPLAAALRRKFKKSGELPKHKFRCVYSEELLKNQPTGSLPTEKRANGTVMHITALFGLTLAGLIVQDIWGNVQNTTGHDTLPAEAVS